MSENRALYFKITRDIQPAINRIVIEIRTELIKFLGSKRIGVWGPYRDNIQGEQSENVIDFIAKDFAAVGFTAITGKGIYIRSVKTHLFEKFFKLLTTVAKIAEKDLYKYLVTLAPNAIFIETSSRSSSLFEEESFFDNIYLENELGVGFLIFNNKPLECSYLQKQENNGINFWLCNGTISADCEENEGKCTFYIQGVNYTTINMFVISEIMMLAIAQDYHHIPKIMKSLMSAS